MNKFVIILLVIAALGGGYYWYTNYYVTEDRGVEQGKLDINVVCESALSYMSFPDGASAEKFVAECKAGEHPEVIERYKADMNLGAGAAI